MADYRVGLVVQEATRVHHEGVEEVPASTIVHDRRATPRPASTSGRRGARAHGDRRGAQRERLAAGTMPAGIAGALRIDAPSIELAAAVVDAAAVSCAR